MFTNKLIFEIQQKALANVSAFCFLGAKLEPYGLSRFTPLYSFQGSELLGVKLPFFAHPNVYS